MTYSVIVNCLLQWLQGNGVIKLKYNKMKEKNKKKRRENKENSFLPRPPFFLMSFCAEDPGNDNFAGNYSSKNKLKRERVDSRLQHLSFFYGGS